MFVEEFQLHVLGKIATKKTFNSKSHPYDLLSYTATIAYFGTSSMIELGNTIKLVNQLKGESPYQRYPIL